MPTNWYMFLVAGLIPLVVGAIYYNPKVMGNAWMKANGFTPETAGGGNMALIFGLSYLFGVIISFSMASLVIHQGGAFSMMMPEVMESGSAVQNEFNTLMQNYGENYRTFGHGAFHGFFASLLFILPILWTIALFEKRSWKYVMIHFGYWAICLMLIGGLICQTLQYAPMN